MDSYFTLVQAWRAKGVELSGHSRYWTVSRPESRPVTGHRSTAARSKVDVVRCCRLRTASRCTSTAAAGVRLSPSSSTSPRPGTYLNLRLLALVLFLYAVVRRRDYDLGVDHRTTAFWLLCVWTGVARHRNRSLVARRSNPRPPRIHRNKPLVNSRPEFPGILQISKRIFFHPKLRRFIKKFANCHVNSHIRLNVGNLFHKLQSNIFVLTACFYKYSSKMWK